MQQTHEIDKIKTEQLIVNLNNILFDPILK